jgi:hypothetical protein
VFPDRRLCQLISDDEGGSQCAQALSQVPLAFVHLHNDEREVPLRCGQQRGQQKAADAADPEQRDGLAGFDADTIKGMDGHCAGLCQRRSFIAAALRHRCAHAGGHLHSLGQAAVGVDAVEHRAFADVGVPGQTLRTGSAPLVRARHHALPDVQIGDGSSDLHDDAHELMT